MRSESILSNRYLRLFILVLVSVLFIGQAQASYLQIQNGSTLQASNVSEYSTTALSYVPLVTINISTNVSGTFSISGMCADGVSGGKCTPFKNGIQMSAWELAVTDSWKSANWNFSGELNTTDLVQIRGKSDSGGTVQAKNMNLSYDYIFNHTINITDIIENATLQNVYFSNSTSYYESNYTVTPESYYRFEGNSYDENQTSNYNCVLQGSGGGYIFGKYGLAWNGTNNSEYWQCGFMNKLVNSTVVTITGWLKMNYNQTPTGLDATIIISHGEAIIFRIEEDYSLTLISYNRTSVLEYSFSTFKPIPNHWYFYKIVRNATRGYVEIDGTQILSYATSGLLVLQSDSLAKGLLINGGVTGSLAGTQDDIRIFLREINATETANIKNSSHYYGSIETKILNRSLVGNEKLVGVFWNGSENINGRMDIYGKSSEDNVSWSAWTLIKNNATPYMAYEVPDNLISKYYVVNLSFTGLNNSYSPQWNQLRVATAEFLPYYTTYELNNGAYVTSDNKDGTVVGNVLQFIINNSIITFSTSTNVTILNQSFNTINDTFNFSALGNGYLNFSSIMKNGAQNFSIYINDSYLLTNLSDSFNKFQYNYSLVGTKNISIKYSELRTQILIDNSDLIYSTYSPFIFRNVNCSMYFGRNEVINGLAGDRIYKMDNNQSTCLGLWSEPYVVISFGNDTNMTGEGALIHDPTMYYDGRNNLYHIYYTGTDDSSGQNNTVRMAESVNGINFTKLGAVNISGAPPDMTNWSMPEHYGTSEPTVINSSDGLYLYWFSNYYWNNASLRGSIFLAVGNATDGFNFTYVGVVDSNLIGESNYNSVRHQTPKIQKNGNKYILIYNIDFTALGYSVSTNPVDFSSDYAHMFFNVGINGTFDDYYIGGGYVDQPTSKMFYAGTRYFPNTQSWFANSSIASVNMHLDFVAPPAPELEFFTPFTPITGRTPQTFTISFLNVVQKITWYINNTQTQQNLSTNSASYTNASAVTGLWTVNATACNTEGCASQIWNWTVDSTPPASITNLQNTTTVTSVNWTWTDPSDIDFDHVLVWLNNVSQANVSAGIQYFLASGLTANTEYTISTHTVDIVGNVNQTWVNQTTRTNLFTAIPPSPIWVSNVTSSYWVNHTWQAGTGNVTDSYNVSVNGTWYNTTASTSFNSSLDPLGWSNITIWAWNNTGFLSATSISNNSQAPAAPTVDTNTTPQLTNVLNETAGAHSINISFSVNQSNAITWTKYGTTGSMTSKTSNQSSGSSRWDNITSLTNATTYYYSVWAANTSNTSLASNSTIQSFMTPEDYLPPGEANGTPVISSYSPTDLTPTIDVNALTTFNAGANQSVQWTWTGAIEGAGDGTTNSTATQTWGTSGLKTVTATCSNINGSCGTIQWDITVIDVSTPLNVINTISSSVINAGEVILNGNTTNVTGTATVWFEYGGNPSSYLYRSSIQSISGNGSFSSKINGMSLISGKTYYYKASGSYNGIDYDGTQKSFTMLTLTPTNYNFDKHFDNFTNSGLNITNMTSIGASPYTDILGSIFWGLLFAVIFIMIWMRQEDITIPSLLGLIVGASLWSSMPADWTSMAMSLTVISFAGMMYSIIKGRQ